ncbi:MAG: hypothetical protein SWH54_16665 [Thermodesulfobacteriota bacterium]|nr:hypothetical protein [Thermodesulfobacteriota bacterium]
MEQLLDSLWFKILDLIDFFESFFDFVFAPLNFFGPAFAISVIALLTVVITKILTKLIKTKRYEALTKEFKHWYNIRQEAMKCEDSEKARLLAKNIDQAKLNKVYYDFFFEGFMLSIVTKYLPILIFAAYVNEAYRTENLIKVFGREYVFKFAGSGPNPVLVGGVFWFIVSILVIYLCWFFIKKKYQKVMLKRNQSAKA